MSDCNENVKEKLYVVFDDTAEVTNVVGGHGCSSNACNPPTVNKPIFFIRKDKAIEHVQKHHKLECPQEKNGLPRCPKTARHKKCAKYVQLGLFKTTGTGILRCNTNTIHCYCHKLQL